MLNVPCDLQEGEGQHQEILCHVAVSMLNSVLHKKNCINNGYLVLIINKFYILSIYNTRRFVQKQSTDCHLTIGLNSLNWHESLRPDLCYCYQNALHMQYLSQPIFHELRVSYLIEKKYVCNISVKCYTFQKTKTIIVLLTHPNI